jgi:hypothetical protein
MKTRQVIEHIHNQQTEHTTITNFPSRMKSMLYVDTGISAFVWNYIINIPKDSL